MSGSDTPEEAASLKILVDTNVWLDSFLGFRAGHKSAMAFLAAAQEEDALLMYPVGALQDIFAILIMELKRKTREVRELDASCMSTIRRTAWSCIDALREGATAAGADESDAWLACKYRNFHWDLEDNMVLAAAQRVSADYLVTNDRILISKATVPALAPSDLTALLLSMRPQESE